MLASPTRQPQSEISRRRLQSCPALNPLTRDLTWSRDGNTVGVAQAAAHYLRAAPTSSARGATASLLLLAN